LRNFFERLAFPWFPSHFSDGAAERVETVLFLPGIAPMTLPNNRPSGDRALMRLYYSYLEPIQIACKKPGRMRRFGVANLDDLPCREIDLASSSRNCVHDCAEIVAAHRLYLGKYIFDEHRTISRLVRGIALVIELDLYSNFESYAEQLKRRRKEIEKASRRGFYCRPLNRNLHRRELFEIETSLRFRSGGPVLAAFFRRPPEPSPADAIMAAPLRPACPLHWYSDWGVFRPPTIGANTSDRLVGYLFLKRVGNVVRLTAMMGHGAWLGDDVVKLLFADAMRWLLDREDPGVQGIRYLHYGAVEHGGAGLAAWKQRFLFEPALFSWQKHVTLVYLVTLLGG
jgi:hypothetical protein